MLKTHRLFNCFSSQSKILNDPMEFVKRIPNGARVMVGGFGLCGIPEKLILALKECGQKDLTVISNNCGTSKLGLGHLLANNQLARIVASYAGENDELTRKFFNGEVALELLPQGTLAERIRAAGVGIPAFYTHTGVGTVVETGGYPIKYHLGGKSIEIFAQPKQVEIFNNKRFIREQAMEADWAIIKAQTADTTGNIRFYRTARNFNEDMVMAAKNVCVEVEEIVEPGQMDPDDIHMSGVFVHNIVKGENYNKVIERLVYDPETYKLFPDKYKAPKGNAIRNKIAQRAAKEFHDGMYVNLGIGIPTIIPAFVDPKIKIHLHTEIGAIGVGNYPQPGQEHPDLVNAGKESITLNPGASIFGSSQSFGIIRGGHLDMTILGSMQVSRRGDIANWMIPGKMVKGMGGAMDLVAAGSKVVVVMEHCAKGDIKLLENCTLPLTGPEKVDKVITDKAVLEKRNGELVLVEIAHDTTLEEVTRTIGWKVQVAEQLGSF